MRKRFYSEAIKDPNEEDINYKTEMCKNFLFKGECGYGSLCRFAHGDNELRFKPLQNELYKTKLCKQWQLNNFCPYGYRCQYRHTVSYNKKLFKDRIK